MNYLDTVKQKRQIAAAKRLRESEHVQTLSTIKSGNEKVTNTLVRQNAKSRIATQPVTIRDKDAPKRDDIDKVASNIDDLIVSHTVESQDLREELEEVCQSLEDIAYSLDSLPKEYDQSEVVDQLKKVVSSLTQLPGALPKPESVSPLLERLITTIDSKEYKPEINVSSPEVMVPELDLTPIKVEIAKLKSIVPGETKVEINIDAVREAVESVKSSIDSLKFPVPNYILPFKDINGKATQAQLNSDGKLPVEVVIGVNTYKTKVDKVTTTDVVYIGQAAIGTATSSAAWKLTKIDKTVTDVVTITYADGGAFTAIYDDRASEVYT